MRILFSAVVLLAFTPALAGERLPWVELPVPDPVPVGYDKCVLVHYTPEGKEITGSNGRFVEPPLTSEDVRAIQTIRVKGWGRVEHCKMSSS